MAERGALRPPAAFLKRTLDIGVGMIAGVVLLPVMLVAAIWLKLDSPGRVFYAQERIGRGGRKFKMYKLRSMVDNAESALERILRSNTEPRREWEQNQKLQDDPRITRAGRFMRKYSLDELPQFLNVLKGDMSLVGPRPITDEETQRYVDNFDIYKSIRPGMTGLWQVSGRNNTGYDERVRYDTYYVRNWSLWLDLCILLRTPWVVLNREGAY